MSGEGWGKGGGGRGVEVGGGLSRGVGWGWGQGGWDRGVGFGGLGRMSNLLCGESSLWRIFCDASSMWRILWQPKNLCKSN